MSALSAREDDELIGRVREVIEEKRLRSIIVGYGDLHGVFRGKRVPAQSFSQDPFQAPEFSDYIWALDIAGEIIIPPPTYKGWMPSWDAGFGDFQAIPDLRTFRAVPWLEGTGLVLANLTQHGEPLDTYPRSVLNHVVDEATAMGVEPVMAAEFEFFVFRDRRDDLVDNKFRDPSPIFNRPAPYGVEQADVDEPLLGLLRSHLDAFETPWAASGIDGGVGQYEVNLSHVSAREAADRALLYKYAVKEFFRLQGMTATFMAKPSTDFGSSGHVHQSLWKRGGMNLFYDQEAEHGLSELGRQYIAGQLATMREFDCMVAPYANSYRRFGPDLAVGTTATWGYDNRTVGIRVVGHDEGSLRVENRRPGADANPYLVMAANLAGGLYGIDRHLQPPDPLRHNASSDPTQPQLPTSLEESLAAFEESEVANQYFGEEFVRYFAATRRWELEQPRLIPSDWEIKRLLLDA